MDEQLFFHPVEVLLVAVVFDLKVEPVEIPPRVLGLPFRVAVRVDALGAETAVWTRPAAVAVVAHDVRGRGGALAISVAVGRAPVTGIRFQI